MMQPNLIAVSHKHRKPTFLLLQIQGKPKTSDRHQTLEKCCDMDMGTGALHAVRWSKSSAVVYMSFNITFLKRRKTQK